MVSYHHVQYRKMDGQTDEQAEESDFIGRSPTNVECPTRWNIDILKGIKLRQLYELTGKFEWKGVLGTTWFA